MFWCVFVCYRRNLRLEFYLFRNPDQFAFKLSSGTQFPSLNKKSQSGLRFLLKSGTLGNIGLYLTLTQTLKNVLENTGKAVQLLAWIIPLRDLHLFHFSLEITTGGAFDKGQMATHGFKGSWRWPNWHHHSSRTPCFPLGMEQRDTSAYVALPTSEPGCS